MLGEGEDPGESGNFRPFFATSGGGWVSWVKTATHFRPRGESPPPPLASPPPPLLRCLMARVLWDVHRRKPRPLTKAQLSEAAAKCRTSLLGQPLKASEWSAAEAAHRAALGEGCDLCGEKHSLGSWRVTPKLSRRLWAAGEPVLPTLLVCRGCWLFLRVVESWGMLEKRLNKLVEILEAAEIGRRLPIKRDKWHLLRKDAALILSDDSRDGRERTEIAAWYRSKGRPDVPKAHADAGDDGEDSL